MHALLAHLAAKAFTGAPRPLGFDEQGREVLTFLEGETVGSGKPWPAWTHAEDVLDQFVDPANDRMADVCQMNADLVLPTSMRTDAEKPGIV